MPKSKSEDGAFSRIYKKTEFDELLIKLGGWSRFQQIQWVLIFLATIPQAWYTYAPAFAARKPKEGDLYCLNNTDIRGEEFCAVWENNTVCQKVGYDVTFSSIVTEVCKICPRARARFFPDQDAKQYNTRVRLRLWPTFLVDLTSPRRTLGLCFEYLHSRFVSSVLRLCLEQGNKNVVVCLISALLLTSDIFYMQ